jgi:hypothetical protein
MANITSKELSALEDQLNYEQTLVKKYRSFADQCADPQLKNECSKVAAKHQSHFDRLMTHLS